MDEDDYDTFLLAEDLREILEEHSLPAQKEIAALEILKLESKDRIREAMRRRKLEEKSADYHG